MRDKAWADGMADLGAARLSGGPQGAADAELTAKLYRRHLDDLSEPAWSYAVAQAIQRDAWWPPVAKLREYADEYEPPPELVKGYLPLSALTPEELEASRERQRAEARRGLELIREKLAEQGIEVGEPVRSMPEAG